MSVASKDLPKLTKSAAKMIESQIGILHAEAYGDAALHDPTGEVDMPYNNDNADEINDVLADPKERMRAIKDVSKIAVLQFDNTEDDNFLEAAFSNLKALARARAMDETAPGERNFYVQEAIDKYNDQVKILADKIEKGDLPEENMTSLTEAFGHATLAQVPAEWAEIETRQQKQGRTL